MKNPIRLGMLTTLVSFLLVASIGPAVASANGVPPYCPSGGGGGDGGGVGRNVTRSRERRRFDEPSLNGTVNPNGLDTKYYFQYGTNADYAGMAGTMPAAGDRRRPRRMRDRAPPTSPCRRR